MYLILQFVLAIVFIGTVITMEPIIIVQGGAGDIPANRIPGKIYGVKLAVNLGYEVLQNNGSALDAVEEAVRSMEKDENFNAGYGSVLNIAKYIEMGASIMDGNNLNAGAVALLKDILHPISIARLVMEKTPHVLLGAHGANDFAKEQGIQTVPPGSLATKFAMEALTNFKKSNLTEIGHTESDVSELGDTVGAVAIDKFGNIAAATSTGGMSGKMVGRIGDTPQLGSGTYADNLIGGVSTTGHGETILKYCLAHKIINTMEFGLSAQNATEKSIKSMTERLNNTAGAITLSKTGDVGVYFSSKRMSWAYRRGSELHYGIEQKQHEIDNL